MAKQRQKKQSAPRRSELREAEAAEQSKDKRSEYLTARQLAQVLQISESTVHRLRRSGVIPAVVLTQRLIRYNLRDVRNALRPMQTAHPHGEAAEEPTPQLSFEDLESGFNA